MKMDWWNFQIETCLLKLLLSPSPPNSLKYTLVVLNGVLVVQYIMILSCGNRDGAVVLSTRLPLMRPGFYSRTQRHKWVEFVVSSPSLSPQKLTFTKSSSIWIINCQALYHGPLCYWRKIIFYFTILYLWQFKDVLFPVDHLQCAILEKQHIKIINSISTEKKKNFSRKEL